MAVVNITAFLICLLYLSYVWEKKLVEVLPVLACILIFVLYALALIRHLSFIDILSFAAIAAFLIWFVKSNKEKRMDFTKDSLNNMTQVSFITALILIVLVIICTSHRVVTWWDDLNFWATDVKSIYYLDGFASKYGNVSPEFGDYPPAGQLFKWYFLHFNPRTFNEGLAFAGYYTMNIIFMLPLLRHLKGKNVIMMFLVALSLWLLPSIADTFGYYGFCADLTLACVYGGFLFAVMDKKSADADRGKDGNFYYARLALYLGVLVLIKSVGFIWAAFGLVFFVVYRIGAKDSVKGGILNAAGAYGRDGRYAHRKWSVGNLAVFASPLIMGGSWMVFCLVMRRVTRTTATAVKYITTDEYGLSGYMGDYAKAFINAFVKLPLHQEKSGLINLTPLAFYMCICLIVILFYRRGLMPEKQGRIVLLFSIISGAVFYGMIFIAHITIFANETQYLEPLGMIMSIERYGAPFTIGMIIFLANIWLEKGEHMFAKGKRVSDSFVSGFWHKYGTYMVFVLFVALTAGYENGYYGLIGYRSYVDSLLGVREGMIDEDARAFLDALEAIEAGSGTRVLYIQRDDRPRWMENSYTSMEASPVSVVYRNINLEDAPGDWMEEEIRASHAFYLYVETPSADNGAGVFDEMAADDIFCYEKLYKIEDDGGR
ncbi:MAG: hypothetical protein NC489_45380, partial [Ruminococcus flavefaciens]|nr:hypothetical protein [Ruminococcus flavefaciens]